MITFRPMVEEDASQVSTMLLRLFERYIAPDFSPADRNGIRQYMSKNALVARFWSNYFTILAYSTGADNEGTNRDTNHAGVNHESRNHQEILIGMIEVLDHKHITLLFVDEPYQSCGIGRALLDQAIDHCRSRYPNLTHITVNASPFAKPIYRHWGFRVDEPASKQMRTAIPMILQLT